MRCAGFLVQEQITLASPRVHMFRVFPAKVSPLVCYSLPQPSPVCWQRWQMLSSGLQWVMCGE